MKTLFGVPATAIMLVIVMTAGQAVAAPFVPTGWGDIGDPNDATGDGTGAGDPGLPGSYVDNGGGSFTVTGSGSDWWGWAERAFVVYEQVAAGTEWRLEADVAWQGADDLGSDWKKAGIFVRNDIAVDAGPPSTGLERQVNTFIAITRPNVNRTSFQYRLDDQSDSMSNQDTGGGQAAKVALQRRIVFGYVFYESFFDRDDGNGWQFAGSKMIPNMVDDPYVGLAVTSHNNGEVMTADFTNVQWVAPVALPLPPAPPGETAMTIATSVSEPALDFVVEKNHEYNRYVRRGPHFPVSFTNTTDGHYAWGQSFTNTGAEDILLNKITVLLDNEGADVGLMTNNNDGELDFDGTNPDLPDVNVENVAGKSFRVYLYETGADHTDVSDWLLNAVGSMPASMDPGLQYITFDFDEEILLTVGTRYGFLVDFADEGATNQAWFIEHSTNSKYGPGEQLTVRNGDWFTGSYSDQGDTAVFYIHQVPEPATMTLLALGAVGLLRRRRRK